MVRKVEGYLQEGNKLFQMENYSLSICVCVCQRKKEKGGKRQTDE